MSRYEGYGASNTDSLILAKSIFVRALFVQGILLTIISVLLFTNTDVSSSNQSIFIAIYFLTTGFLEIASIYIDRSVWGFKLLGGITSLWVGLLIVSGRATQVYFLALETLLLPAIVLLILHAIKLIRIHTTKRVRLGYGSWWFIYLLSLLDVGLVIILIVNYLRPIDTLLPWLVGAVMLFGGFSTLVYAFRLLEPDWPAPFEQRTVSYAKDSSVDFSGDYRGNMGRVRTLTIAHPDCLAKGKSSSFIAYIHPRTQMYLTT